MSYTIQRAAHKLWLNRRVYFFILLELAMGIAATLCGFLSAHAAQERLALCAVQSEANDISIAYSSSRAQAEPAIGYEDFLDFRAAYGERLDFSYFLYTNAVYWQSGSVENAVVLCMNTEAFPLYFGAEPQEAVYVGKDIKAALDGGEITFAESWLQIDGASAKIGEQSIAQILPLNTGLERIVTSRLESFDIDVNCLVLLPESAMEQLENRASDLLAFLRLRPADGADADLGYRIVDELSARHPGYTYEFASLGEELEAGIADLTQEVRLLSWISRLTLAITAVGIVGVLFLFLQRRQREYAIAITQGANHGRLFGELFCEVLLLNALGGGAGTAAAAALAPKLSTSMFACTFQWSAALLGLGIVLAITICSCVSVFAGLRSIYPASLLRS